VNIYWSPHIINANKKSLSNIRYQTPEHATEYLKDKCNPELRESNFLRCPAFIKQQKNLYALKFSFSYELYMDVENDKVKSDKYDQSFFDEFVYIRDIDNAMLSLPMSYVFIAENPVDMEYTSAYNVSNGFVDNTIIIPGSFDIGKWYRPLDLSFIVKDKNKKVTFNENDAYAFVNFHTDKKVNLIRFDTTPQITELFNSILLSKFAKSKEVNSLNWFYNLLEQSKYKNKILKLVKENVL
jgi:hypothetical protein